MKRRLLRDRPYKISSNSKQFNSMRVVLHPDCFKLGEEVYQVKREDGVVELIPVKIYREISIKNHLKNLDK